MLCRRLGLARPDDDVHRLTFAITGLAVQLFVSQDLVDAIRPSLLNTPKNVDTWAQRLTGYAVALVEAEVLRRKAIAKPTAVPAARSGRKKT